MSLTSATKELRAVSREAKGLLTTIIDLARRGLKVNVAQKAQIKKFTERLDQAAREASRTRRDAEIEQLTETIKALESGLSRLPPAVRPSVEARILKQKTRRGRLRGQKGTDFGGILKANEQAEIAELVKQARDEVNKKRFAADFLDSVMNIADLALSLAGKLAM